MIHRFHCDFCDRDKTHESDTTTGYGTFVDDKKACFDCCAILDKQSMDKAVADKNAGRSTKVMLYLSRDDQGYYVGNWPGTLKLRCTNQQRSDVRCFGRYAKRIDVWFLDHRGRPWHGVNQGDTQITHCRPVKR